MQLKASVWKLSKSVKTTDESELRGHIQSVRLICFQHVFEFLVNNFQRHFFGYMILQYEVQHA